MKVIKVEGKYTFDFKPEGAIFFGTGKLLMLDCNTGLVKTKDLFKLEEHLSPPRFARINFELLMNNIYRDANFEIMGVE